MTKTKVLTHEQLKDAGEALNRAQPYGIGAVMLRYAESWKTEVERCKCTHDCDQGDDCPNRLPHLGQAS